VTSVGFKKNYNQMKSIKAALFLLYLQRSYLARTRKSLLKHEDKNFKYTFK
jgi:hypothetical protein